MASRCRICRDERGAIMVIAVFFAIFALSILYLGVGAAETVLLREHLQDAADAAALTGAITHARIMNLIVLLNMIMAVLLAILVTLKLVEGTCIVGIAIAAGLAWFTGGSSLAAVAPLNSVRSTMVELYEQAEDPVFTALETLHDVASKLAEVAPEASTDAVNAAIEHDPEGVVSAGFAAPTIDHFPVVDDKYEKLCGKAGEMVITLAKIPLSPLPFMGELMDLLNEPMERLTSSLSEWFCGDGSNGPANLDQTVERGYPRTQTTKECEEERLPSRAEAEQKSATSSNCEKADAERAAAQPDADGNCSNREGDSQICDQTAALARRSCNPTQEPRPYAYRYQRQEMRVNYTWNGRQWVRGIPEVLHSELVKQDGKDRSQPPPCGTPFQSPTVAIGYFADAHPDDDASRFNPACSDERAPSLLPFAPATLQPQAGDAPPVTTVEYQQVTHIFSCLHHENVPVKVKTGKTARAGGGDGTATDDGESNSKSPKKLKAGVKLGGEAFQIRSVMIADRKQRDSARIVRLGNWGAGDPDNPFASLDELGSFSVAQAEYLYDDSATANDPDAWMWNMNWRARLRRFELPDKREARKRLDERCRKEIHGGDCSRVLDVAEDWADLIQH